jgi:SAM-dependent methyltransferase
MLCKIRSMDMIPPLLLRRVLRARSSVENSVLCRRRFQSSTGTRVVPSQNETNKNGTSTTIQQQVHRMRQQIMQTPQDPATAWESLWQEGVTPWDLGMPTPALISEVRLKRLCPQMTLIPGCGSGHDLVALARYLDKTTTTTTTDDNGHPPPTIVGLELSPTSLQRAQQVLNESFEQEGPTRTIIDLYQGDFFALPSTWKHVYRNKDESSSSLSETQSFDFILDYLFFCAIPPELRQDWGQQITRLLSQKNGHLLTLMFPYSTTKRSSPPQKRKGPPYAVSLEDYTQALTFVAHDGNALQLQTPYPYGSLDTVPVRQGQEVIGWWSFPTTTTDDEC